MAAAALAPLISGGAGGVSLGLGGETGSAAFGDYNGAIHLTSGGGRSGIDAQTLIVVGAVALAAIYWVSRGK